MPAPIAIFLCAVGVAILFYLNRNRSVRNSPALWIPVIWLILIGSRPIGQWIDFGPIDAETASNANLEGSPYDAAIFGILIVIGVSVLASRSQKTSRYLGVITPIIIYFVYCLISVAWSPIPIPSLKRCIKDMGEVVMMLIIITDTQPIGALRQVLSRVGFILLPLSVALIRYTMLGRLWNNDGLLLNVGVTTNKNSLGLIVFVISLGVFWNFRWLLMNRGEPNRGRRLVAQGTLLAIGLFLLLTARSSTSLACFLLGSALMLATQLSAIRYRTSRVHMLVFAMFAFGGLAMALGGSGEVANALGRDSSFSGRTEIWAALLPTVTNPIFGTGFDSYWNSPNVLVFQSTMRSIGWYNPESYNSAHNGYLQVYLDLGWVGVCLLVVVLVVGYSRACKAFKRDREIGGLLLAYIITGMIYSITEAGFREMTPSWFFLLLAVIYASGVNAGLLPSETAEYRVSRRERPSLVSVYENRIRPTV